MTHSIQPVSNLSAVLDRYDAIISDVWGVLHNGLVATPGAKEALAAAKAGGKPVILLTNAPRPPHSIAQQLLDLGIDETSYSAIVSSGGVTRDLLAKEGPVPFFHLGPDRDVSLYEGLEAFPVSFDDAKLILCTGPFNDEEETAEDFRDLLATASARRLPFYCANPDIIVERGDRLIPCAGAIAELYEELGGEVIWVGKPRPLVYSVVYGLIEQALGRKADPRRILCIGDALRTDIAGAIAHGHDSIMTLAGIHGHQIGLHGQDYDLGALEALSGKNNTRPTMCMVSLRW